MDSRSGSWGARVLVPVVVLLLLTHFLLAFTAVRRKSVVFDEIAHITAGASYWKTGDYRLQPENGLLPQLWGTLPLLAGSYAFPSLDREAWRTAQVWVMGHAFFYESGNDPEVLLRRARLFASLVGVATCAAVFLWSRRLFGPEGGLVSLVLAAFSPTFLALGPIVTSDLFVTLTFTVAVGCLWWTLHRMSPLSVVTGAVATAALLLSKMSGVLILPIMAILVVVRLLSPEPLVVSIGRRRIAFSGRRRLVPVLAAAACGGLVVFVLLWAAYGFRYSAFSAAAGRGRFLFPWVVVLKAPGVLTPVLAWARAARLLPEAYLYALAFVRWYVQGRVAFLNGHTSMVGWRTFFPYCFLVKTPLSLFFVLALGAAASLRAWRRADAARIASAAVRGLRKTAPLFVLLAVYGTVAVASRLNLGHRHLAPIYPALLILAGSAGSWLRSGNRTGTVLLGGALLLAVVESARIHPHYLAYFNPLAGGPRGAYRHLVDSSLDWGQDLLGLRDWLGRRGLRDSETTPVYLSYFGTADPRFLGVPARLLPCYFEIPGPKEPFELLGGTYCISATMLQSLRTEAVGRWAVPYEEAYQHSSAEVARYMATASDAEARRRLVAERGEEAWQRTIHEHDVLRFGRLCAYLRRREPDDDVGFSILIYRLQDSEVREALYGPPAELLPEVEVTRVPRGAH